MTDEKFLQLVSDELKVAIDNSEIATYRKGVINIAKKLNAEKRRKEIEIIKKNVLENFSCSDCKKLGLFAECQKKEKSCETIVSDWFDEVIGG